MPRTSPAFSIGRVVAGQVSPDRRNRAGVSWVAVCVAISLCLRGRASAQIGTPEWQRREATLKPLLVAVSAPEAEFTQITSLDVDSRGNIYVADWLRAHVSVLSPRGDLLRNIGRKGAGPGEFQSLRVVQILPEDSLLTYDPSLGRVTVFEPGTFATKYSFNFPAATRRVPFDVHRSPNNRLYLARFRRGYPSGADPATYRNRKDVVAAYRVDGTLVRDSMLVFPSKEFLVTRYRGEFSITPHPFGEEGFWAVPSSGRVYVATSHDLLIRSYDTAGGVRDSFRVAFDPPRLTKEEMRKTLSDWSPQTWDKFGAVLLERAPSRWPAVRGMLVDEAGRLWLRPGGPASTTRWVAYSNLGVFVTSAVFPADFELRLIRGNRAYGVGTDSDGVPSIRVYVLR